MVSNKLSQFLLVLVLGSANAGTISTWKKIVQDGSSSMEYSAFKKDVTLLSLIECATWVTTAYPVKGEALKFNASESSCQALRYDPCPTQPIGLQPATSTLLMKEKPKRTG